MGRIKEILNRVSGIRFLGLLIIVGVLMYFITLVWYDEGFSERWHFQVLLLILLFGIILASIKEK